MGAITSDVVPLSVWKRVKELASQLYAPPYADDSFVKLRVLFEEYPVVESLPHNLRLYSLLWTKLLDPTLRGFGPTRERMEAFPRLFQHATAEVERARLQEHHDTQPVSEASPDIPPLDKTSGEWVKQVEAVNILLGDDATFKARERKTKALSKARGRSNRKSLHGQSGIDNADLIWHNDPETKGTVWYYKPSLNSAN